MKKLLIAEMDTCDACAVLVEISVAFSLTPLPDCIFEIEVTDDQYERVVDALNKEYLI